MATVTEVFEDPRVVALVEAARTGSRAAAEAAVSAGADVNARGTLGVTPALFVTVERDVTALRVLLEVGASPDLADDEGHPPLEWAVMFEDPAFVETLLARGADPNARSHLDEPVTLTAIDADQGHLFPLLAAGADLEAKAPSGDTAILRLAMGNRFEEVARLIEQGADFTRVDATGGTVALYVQESRVDPLSPNAEWREKVRAMLEARGVTFPVPRPWETR